MAVTLEGTTRRYIGRSIDVKPRPGLTGADGVTPTALDILAGSTFLEHDTGVVYRWNGNDWTIPSTQDGALLLLGELLLEARAIRSGIELGLSLEHGVHVNLITEAITQLEERDNG